MSSKTLYIVDISSYIFRAYYAIRALKTSQGIPTNATYGVITMLLKLIHDNKVDHLVLAFDSPTPTFRKDIYADYKSNRPPPPEDLLCQFDQIKEFIEAYPLPMLTAPGFEADDIIATLTSRYGSKECPVFIVSADKDLMQLIGPGVVMVDSMRNKVFTEKEVLERFGVKPEQVVDILGLAGDASDNIPGVKGIGEKTAAQLIQEYGSLENLLKTAPALKGKVGENLVLYREEALLSKKLATLNKNVPLKDSWDFFELNEANLASLNHFYKKYEFNRLILEEKILREDKTINKKEDIKGYELILDEVSLLRWVGRLKNSKTGFALDTETTGLDPMRAKLVGLSFSSGGGESLGPPPLLLWRTSKGLGPEGLGPEGCYIPLAHSYLGCPKQLEKNRVLDFLKPLLEDEKIPKFGQHLKYDMEILWGEGIHVKGVAGDSLIASYLINPESTHNLDRLAAEYLDYETLRFDEVVGRGKTFDEVDLKTACRYSAEDADISMRLVEKLHPLLKKEGLWELYQQMELPLVSVLLRMETHGVSIHLPYLEKLGKEFGGRLKTLEKEIYAHAGIEFNLNSPKQVSEILFGKLALPTKRKTKTGFSTDVDVLTELAPLHPVPRFLLDYRLLAKLQSTYIDGLQRLLNPKTGRIHTSYNQTIAATGRLSSSDPNLQNIPIRTDDGKRIRQAFCAPEGYVLLSADYSQIELRLLAAFSGDIALLEAFKNDEDIHTLSAGKIFSKNEKEITPELRSIAKTVNFGVIYGQTPFGLSKQLGISAVEAKNFIEAFYTQFPQVASFRDKIVQEARKAGMVATWKKRRRLLPDINSKNQNLKMNAERTAFNTVFQGSAADLIKTAMINIDRRLETEKLKSRMILQVHDELVFEVLKEELDLVRRLIVHEMEKALPCEVHLKVDVGIGENWAEAH